MSKAYKFVIFSLIAIDIMLFIWLLLRDKTIKILNPKGLIALQERNVIITAILLMLLIVVPAVFLTFFTAWKYRAGNKKEDYSPDAHHSIFFQLGLWAIPSIFVLVLAIMTWKATHFLDPYKHLTSDSQPLTIQVVALRWKWLFIYPKQNIATVNFIQFPISIPINFELTGDAPMSSFWIPQLGGQMFAMTGMGTQLHLIADTPGEYAGSAAEINGQGFSGMKFVARASSQSDFDTWVLSVKKSRHVLGINEYNKLAAPSENNAATFYSSTDENLYNKIVMKFLMPTMKGMNYE